MAFLKCFRSSFKFAPCVPGAKIVARFDAALEKAIEKAFSIFCNQFKSQFEDSKLLESS